MVEVEEGSDAAKSFAAAPELVITLEAEESVIKEKLFAQPEPSVTEEQMAEALATWSVLPPACLPAPHAPKTHD